MLKFLFKRGEDKFFILFEESVKNMVKTAESLKLLVNNWSNVEGKVAEITELEHAGDTITHQIMAQLNRTFVTPFDREDITKFAQVLDDVTDFIQSAVDSMYLYKIDRPTQRAKELADIIVQAAHEISRAMPLLRRHGTELKHILEHCVEINRLENMADRIFRSAQADLFSDASDTTDIINIIKWREIYEYMESATDRCEDVADVLEGVVLKHA